MAWRFKASKYKNAAPIAPKKENLVSDLSIGSYKSHGNFIAASAAYVAFNWESQGSNLAVLPLDAKGRQIKAQVPLIYAHTDFVTDFQFSPFDDGLLATGSQDLSVKLWRIPESGMPAGGITQPELVLPSQPRRVETVNFHPSADSILATTSFDSLVTWDLIQAKEVFYYDDHEDEVQSVAWQHNGQLLATQSKDCLLRIFDPRANKCVMNCESHLGIKDSRVVWINGPENRLFTTGFSADRNREITVRDMRNLATPQANMELDLSSGILVPLYDPDTNMCFLSGKGDRNIQFIELTDQKPFIVEGLRYSGEQTKGACLVPKRAMNVMEGEVNRVLQLCGSSIVPITWQVPRKSYREYHSDIYPETTGLEAACGPSSWFKGNNQKVPRINLDPKKRPKEKLTVFQGPLADRDPEWTSAASPKVSVSIEAEKENGHQNGSNGTNATTNNKVASFTNGNHNKPSPRPRCVVKANSVTSHPQPLTPKPQIAPRITNHKPKLQSSLSHEFNGCKIEDEGLEILKRQPSIRDRKKLFENTGNKEMEEKPENPAPEKTDKPKQYSIQSNTFLTAKNEEEPKLVRSPTAKRRPVSRQIVRVAKFKHLKGDVMLKGKFENLKNLSRTMPAESDFFKANPERIAVPLTGPGGKLAIFETSRPGRIPDGVTPCLINGSTVLDFAFDPFNAARLAVGCDDGIIRVWTIPKGGLASQVNEPTLEFSACTDKVQMLKWHPLAQDILCSIAFDKSVKIWDLNQDLSQGPQIELEGHSDQLFSGEWSGCGRYLGTVCKDGKIRIYEPRKSAEPIAMGGEIVPKKGARLAWVLGNQYLIVTGFSKQSQREVMVFKVGEKFDTVEKLHTEILDVSPSILIPHYDEDSSTLFLTSKGESTVATFEVSLEFPHLFALSPYRPSGLHIGLSFLPKNILDVKQVEFARAFRLTNTTIEPISFTVPRVKTEFFQSDLFPSTRVLWTPTLTAQEWLQGSAKQAALISLCPEGMPALLSDNNRGSAAQEPHSSRPQSKQQKSNFPAMEKKLTGKEATKQAEADLENSVSNRVETTAKLEQDSMEGVDENEWNEDN